MRNPFLLDNGICMMFLLKSTSNAWSTYVPSFHCNKIATSSISSSAVATLPFSSPSTILSTSQKKRRMGPLYQMVNNDGDAKNRDDDGSDDEFDEEENDIVYYDDFDFTIGSASSSAAMPSYSPSVNEDANRSDTGIDVSTPKTTNLLQDRIREVKQQEIVQETKLLKNWSEGDWSVRGFSLDTEDASQLDDGNNGGSAPISPPIHISAVTADTNHLDRVWVGRTNGSLVWVKIGSDPITKFRSKLIAESKQLEGSTPSSADEKGKNEQDSRKDRNNDNYGGDTGFSVSSQLVPDNEWSSSPVPESEEEAVIPAEMDNDPFEILYEFPAGPNQKPIRTILSVPDEDYIFTTCEGSGEIQQWKIEEEYDVMTGKSVAGPTKAIPCKVLRDNAHTDTVISLKTVNYGDAQILLSVSADGSIALWDLITADLIYKCRVGNDKDYDETMVVQQALPYQVNCADVDDRYLYIGTSSGCVLAYSIERLMNVASTSNPACPIPDGCFMAYQEKNQNSAGVTSILSAGEGSLGRGQGKTRSSLIITGSANGVIKQWEMISRPSSPGAKPSRLDAWPKMASQRLPKKAHLFIGHSAGHNIVSIINLDKTQTKILSGSTDGTIRMWNTQTGKELYRMDGFTISLSSLCIQDDMLITDGMKQYVCIHDFDIDPFDPNKMFSRQENSNDGDDKNNNAPEDDYDGFGL